MKLKWEWFIGGRAMFWISIIAFIIFILGFVFTYIIDPTMLLHMDIQSKNSDSIKEISEKYVESLGITVDRPIKYHFVKYKNENWFESEPDDQILLGTFHEWNGVYYINISVNLYNMPSLEKVVVHETRHMLVEYMKDEDVVDLTDYTEEIAQNENASYDSIFRSGIYLLKYFQE